MEPLILGPNFGPPNKFLSEIFCFHEYVHAYMGWNDTEVAQKFDIKGVSSNDTSGMSRLEPAISCVTGRRAQAVGLASSPTNSDGCSVPGISSKEITIDCRGVI